MIGVHQGIMQIVVLVGELDRGLGEDDALLHAVAGGEVTGGDVADDDLQRDDGYLLDERVALAELFNKVGRDAGLLHLGHQAVGHLVVDDALADDGTLLCAVKGGGVVLVGNDDEVGIFGGVNLLGLAFVELFFLFHDDCSPFILYFC